MKIFQFFAAFFLCICSNALADSKAEVQSQSKGSSPRLTIQGGSERRIFSREGLLHSPQMRKLTVTNDPVFKKSKINYSVVPVASLFAGLEVDDAGTIQFTCMDGFSGPISPARLLNQDPAGAIAYLAIETVSEPWPTFGTPEAPRRAGPFYLIWQHAEKSKISTEEWPYQLLALEAKPSLAKQFPLTLPDAGLPENGEVWRGYRSFMKNCFSCHTLNGQGTSKKGPDLNLPFNPTEYMRPPYLARLIRDPQSLRAWPQANMIAFDRKILSDRDVQDIIHYLQAMAKKKPKL